MYNLNMMPSTQQLQWEPSEKYPVFYTQGGGYVREHKASNGQYYYTFIHNPPAGFQIGDEMPEEWGIVAANYNAIEAIE